MSEIVLPGPETKRVNRPLDLLKSPVNNSTLNIPNIDIILKNYHMDASFVLSNCEEQLICYLMLQPSWLMWRHPGVAECGMLAITSLVIDTL